MIGVGIWFAGMAAIGIVLAVAGRQEDQIDKVGDGGAAIFFLWLLGAIAGWFWFAYLDGPPARRWAILACVEGGTWLVMAAVALNMTA